MAVLFISLFISSIIFVFSKGNASKIDLEIKSNKRKKMLSQAKENPDKKTIEELNNNIEELEQKLQYIKLENKKKFLKILVIITLILFILSYIGQNASR